MKKLFAPGADLSGGIIGAAEASNPVILNVRENKYNTLIYQVTLRRNSTSFGGDSQTYSKSDLGSGATYYPNIWISTNIKESAFAIDRKYADDSSQKPCTFLQNPIDVTVTIEQNGSSHFTTALIPRIGELGANPLFDKGHYCYDASKIDDCPCSTWTKVKFPDMDKNIDIMIAGHRGVWGSDLGKAAPENSRGAIDAAKGVVSAIEFDVTIMKDDILVGSHDYNLKRLSDFTGSDQIYLFDINYPTIANLKLRKRNLTVSDYHYLKFDEVVDLLLKNELVIFMDCKDIRAHMKGGKCVANCDYDPATNPNADKMIKDSWRKIFRLSYNIAKQKDALAYISYETSMKYDEVKIGFTEEEISKVLFMPMVQRPLDKALDFVDDWINKAGKKIIAFETNFRIMEQSDPFLAPFSRDGKNYENILHYVYAKTGLRPGVYSEEPCGPRGVVNRWADWKIKNMNTDRRGNLLDIINVPYGNILLITSDRIDVWNQIIK